jgi:hypothetical protein
MVMGAERQFDPRPSKKLICKWRRQTRSGNFTISVSKYYYFDTNIAKWPDLDVEAQKWNNVPAKKMNFYI